MREEPGPTEKVRAAAGARVDDRRQRTARSAPPRRRLRSWRGTSPLLVALVALAVPLGGAGFASAGGATVARVPAVSQGIGTDDRPAEAECAVPEVAPAAAGAAATTSASTAGGVTIRFEFAQGQGQAQEPPVIAAATPTAGRATPVATPDPAAALADELAAVAGALAACLSDGEARTVARLATEAYLGQLYGGGEPLPDEEYLALAADLDPVPTRVRSVRDVERTDDDEATAEVVSVVGNQLLRGRWTFVQAPPSERDDRLTTWRVDAEAPLPLDAPAGAAALEIAIEEYAFGPTASTVEGSTLALEGRNAGAEEHELLVLRLDDGATTADLLREPGPGLPDGVAYVGQVTVPPGDRAELVLVDLDPGDYAIVCLFPTDRGTPHLALGMEATFTVEEA